MSLIYITGLSGSGKSTVLKELEKRGLEAHGVDEEGFADWVDRKTGVIADFPHHDADLDIHKWYRKHRWVLSVERITGLRVKSIEENKTIYLSGVAEGLDTVVQLFDRVIALSVDEQTIRSRINNRTDNNFGKDPDEMSVILSWLDGFDKTHVGFGADIVDASRPVEVLVDDILSLS